jgi:hypothetical protein
MNAALSTNGVFFASTVEAAGTSGDKVALSSTSGSSTVFADGQGGEFAYPQCVADRTVPGLSYTIWAGHSTQKSRIAAFEQNGTKTGPVNISQLAGTNQTAWRYSSSGWAHSRGGLWLAYENTGDRHVYIRRVQMRDKHGDITLVRVPVQNNLIGGIEVWPNPARVNVFITANFKFQISNFKFQIFNINGKQVFSESSYSSSKIRWNAQNHPSGNYIIKVESGNRTISKKIMISR